MKFKQYLNEMLDHYESDEDDDDLGGSADSALKAYIKDPAKKNWLNQYAEELIDAYGNEKPEKVYRGLNFDTKEDYEEFIKTISSGKIKIENTATSWTRSLSTARQFAKTKPSYMEFMSSEKMKLIDAANKKNEYVVGYRGIILEIDIDKEVGVDTKLTPFSAEDEIIIFKGEYKCKYHELKKNSDRINDEGLEAILAEIEKAQDSEDKNTKTYNDTMLQKIIKDHKSELTPEMKKFFGKKFLTKPPSFGWGTGLKGWYSDDVDKLIINMNRSPLLTYGEDLFNKEDVEKYLAKCKKEHEKMLDIVAEKVKKAEEQDHEIEWNMKDADKWFRMIGLSKKFNSIFSKMSDKYHKLNSRENLKNINKLKGKDHKKAVDDFADELKKLIKSMGAA